MSDAGRFRVLALCGSLRADSANHRLLAAAAALAPPEIVVRWHPGLDALPHFNPDRDGAEAPPAVAHLRRMVAEADGLLISSPEYAHGVPGTLKNALDWLVSGVEIVAVPIGLLNAAPRATHAQAALAETLRTMAAEVLPEASPAVPLSGRSLTTPEILADPALAEPLRAALLALYRRMERDRIDWRRLVPPRG